MAPVSTLFLLVFLTTVFGLNQLSPTEECIKSAPRTFTKALAFSLCEGCKTYESASSAIECAQSVGRSLTPKLTVELCSVSGNAAGRFGGLCVTAAAKELTSLDYISEKNRLLLCIGIDSSSSPRGPIQCFKEAGKLSRDSNARKNSVEWLSDVENRVSLCQSAKSKEPVSCIESFYFQSRKKKMHEGSSYQQAALKLCSKATSSAPGQCASHALDLPSSSRPDIELIPQLCKSIQPSLSSTSSSSLSSSLSLMNTNGPALCLKDAPSAWSMTKRVELCSNAINNDPALCCKLVKGKTSHGIEDKHLLTLCKTPKTLYMNNDFIMMNNDNNTSSNFMQLAALCVNSAPLQMLADDKIKLCDASSYIITNQIMNKIQQNNIKTNIKDDENVNKLSLKDTTDMSSSSFVLPSLGDMPGPSACAKAALSLRSYEDKALLCQGAYNTGPADCLNNAPYTMDIGMKVKLCSKSLNEAPGKCASLVRNHIISTTAVSSHQDSESDSESELEGLIQTVPIAPSEAAAAGMLGLDPIDTTHADLIAVELCHGTTSSVEPSNCFIKAPYILDESSSSSSSSSSSQSNRRGNDLRASLCIDAENDNPAKCASLAYNYSLLGRTVSNLGAGVIVSLCHNVASSSSFPSSSNHHQNGHSHHNNDDNVLDEFGSISCAYSMLSGVKWWSNSEETLSNLVLKLCTHAPSNGPALCAAACPNRFTPQERIELCRKPPSSFNKQSISSDKTVNNNNNNNDNGDDNVNWLTPALCASESPLDISTHKIITTCKGAKSITPAHCLRASPGLLNYEDLIRCQEAVSIPSEVHVQVYEDIIGKGDVNEEKRKHDGHLNLNDDDEKTNGMIVGDENNNSTIDNIHIDVSINDDVSGSIEDMRMVESNNKVDVDNLYDDDDNNEREDVVVSSTLRIEATIVDQFQQPIMLNQNEKFQVISSETSDKEIDLALNNMETLSDESSSQTQTEQQDNKKLDELIIDLDKDTNSAKSLRFSLNSQQNTKKNVVSNEKDANHNDEKISSSSSEQNVNDHEVELFSRIISFALKGDVINSIKVLFTDDTSNQQNDLSKTSHESNIHQYASSSSSSSSFSSFKQGSYEMSKKLGKGISIGLKHDWLSDGIPEYAWIQSLNLKKKPCSKRSHHKNHDGDINTNNDFDTDGYNQDGDDSMEEDDDECLDLMSSMKQVDAKHVGQIAGAVVALPFRTGQGFGHVLRTGSLMKTIKIKEEEDTSVLFSSSSSSSVVSTSIQSSESQTVSSNKDNENDVLDYIIHQKKKNDEEDDLKLKLEQNDDDVGKVEVFNYKLKYGPYFDIFIGIIFTLVSWGGVVYYIYNKLGFNQSKFGLGDFEQTDFNDKSNKSKTPFWRGRLHTKLERNERAINAKNEEIENRINDAIIHDQNFKLLGTKGGVAKRRKKFVLGAS